MDAMIQAILGVVQGLFGFLFSIILGFMEGVMGPILSVIGAPKTIPDQALAMIHSAAIAIDTLIPMNYFLPGLAGIFVVYCLKWGVELMLLPIRIAMWIVSVVGQKVAATVGTLASWAGAFLELFI